MEKESPNIKPKAAPTDQTPDLSFEEAYRQLMDLVKKMESGELPLADSVKAYEQGVKLKAYCEQLLKEAELKIETLKINN